MPTFNMPKMGWQMLPAILLLSMVIVPGAYAKDTYADKAASGTKEQKKQNWSFGQSADRKSPIWIRGIDADDISSKAKPKIKNKKGNAADTSNGINAALSRAEKKDAGGVGIKMKNEYSAWKTGPTQSAPQADENIAREGKHIFGAYAGVNATDNLNISVGPELIIKDEQNVRESANASQPDAALGLGMNFQLDF